MEKILRVTQKLLPKKLFDSVSPIYHYGFAILGALIYRFPAKKINVVAVTGTKGKTTTVELINAILEEAGFTTALCGTVRFKIANESKENLYKMSMPGRFVLQRFLRQAVNHGCQYAVMEMTSQGAIQYRNKGIDIDALVFTNLSPEHIEAHGSFENYVLAKLSLGKSLEKSSKKRKILVVNKDDESSERFLALNIPEKFSFTINDASPYILQKQGLEMTLDHKKTISQLSGLFNIYNILGAVTYAKTQGISSEIIIRAIEKFKGVRGRLEKIDAGQDFNVIVDYAHTADSLEKVYQIYQNSRRICVLGNTGGGRDTWKRKEMGRIADSYCEEVILTNEDPYDEDPANIVAQMKEGMEREPKVIMDRREALHYAISQARTGDTVIITGKGTDPYIMGPHGTKTPWDDATVAREELLKVMRGETNYPKETAH